MPKGDYLAEFELFVMLAVLRMTGDAYGASIRREIEEQTGRPVSIGAVYATLGRLSDKGFVEFAMSDPIPVRGGRARKHVHLTERGRNALGHSSAMLLRMMHGTPLSPSG